MFRLAIPEFKTECSKRRFIVREFTYSEESIKTDKEQEKFCRSSKIDRFYNSLNYYHC